MSRQQGAAQQQEVGAKCADSIKLTVEWTAVEALLPDDDNLVLIALNDDDVWTGFLDGGIWRYVDATPIDAERVTHWMDLPPAPALVESGRR